MKEQAARLADQARAIEAQSRQIESLRTAVDRAPTDTPSPAGNVVPAAYQVPRAATAPARIQPAQAPEPSPPPPSGPAAPTPTRPEIADPSLARGGGVLTPRGTLVVEPSVEYLYSSDNRVLLEGFSVVQGITLGNVDIREVNRRTVTAALAGRFGITDRFEIDAKIPFLYREDTTTSRTITGAPGTLGEETVLDADGSDLGDIEIGAHYQFNSGANGWPFFIGNLRWKSRTGTDPFEVDLDPNTGLERELPTGTGFDAIEPSLTVIYPSDPVVLFGNLRYIWNIERDVTIQPSPGTGGVAQRSTIDPGDGIGLSFGIGFGLNERASLSLGYEHVRVLETEQDGAEIAGSDYDIASFLLGLSYSLSPRTSLNLGVSIGATEAAPDARIGLRIPIRFQVY